MYLDMVGLRSLRKMHDMHVALLSHMHGKLLLNFIKFMHVSTALNVDLAKWRRRAVWTIVPSDWCESCTN